MTRKQREIPEKKQPSIEQRILPMQLNTGDRLVDASGEYEVIGRPHTTKGGKDARVRAAASTPVPLGHSRLHDDDRHARAARPFRGQPSGRPSPRP
jgi:hypothetical protein